MRKRKNFAFVYTAMACLFLSFTPSAKGGADLPLKDVLTDSIERIVSPCPGEIGVAVIINDKDTVRVNDKSAYPLMSVFKVHQALALCR